MGSQGELCAIQGPSSRVELSVSCSGLANKDTFSKSDPFCVLFVKDAQGTWREFGRTETIMDTLNPAFVRSFTIDYFFEAIQPLRFQLYDEDSKSQNLREQDYMGQCEVSLGDIVGCRGQTLTRPVMYAWTSEGGKKHGQIVIRAEEVSGLHHTVHMRLSCSKLEKKDFFGSSDPFLVISRCREDGSYVPVYRTEMHKNTTKPSFNPIEISIQHLCNGDVHRPLRIECFDWNRSGDHELIGTGQVSLEELRSEHRNDISLINEKKRNKKGYTHSGLLHPISCQIVEAYSFLDYIAGGCGISLVVAIDFTSSNGAPNNPVSLHYRDPHRPNQYHSAIESVGSILSSYDTDQKFPVFGFGAKLPTTGRVSHCFPLNGNPYDPEVTGVHGILQAYYQGLSNVSLYGPTIFSEIIRTAASYASRNISQECQNYTILLILTDGIINDMDATIAQIVQASSLPLSIIIVGVGSADFASMNVLDADDAPLRSGGKQMERDIVQFVPFNKFAGDGASLSREVLAEVPQQLVSFMRKKGFVPNRRVEVQPQGPSAPM